MNRFTSLLRQSAAGALLVAAAASVTPASAVTIETGSYANSGLGAEFVTPYDNFVIDGATVVVALTQSPVEISLGEYSFEVGPNCYSCTLTPSYDAMLDITIDGMTRQLDLPYSWSSSGPNDLLSFATPAPVLFDFGALGVVTIAVETLAAMSSPGGMVYGQLNATASVTAVPEPSSYALMLAGLGIVGFIAKRRRA
jgi:PEP-CTERM motif-containing protein